MTRSHRRGLGMGLALILLLAAWQASADTCGRTFEGLRCGPVSAMVAFSPDALFPTAAANSRTSSRSELAMISVAADTGFNKGGEERPVESPASQATSLLLLGSALALAAKSLKRQASS